MSVQSRVIERALKLPPPITRRVTVTKDHEFPAYDGEVLLADLYEPHGVPDAPTLLIRTPYGRNGLLSRVLNRSFAERGFIVVVAAVRGTNGAGGTFDPFVHDADDGLATLDWIEKQRWHHGKVVTFGPSYLGYVQFALGQAAGDRITAMVPMIGTSTFRDVLFTGGNVFGLGAFLAWTARMVTGEKRGPLTADLLENLGDRRARRAMNHLPLSETDTLATKRTVGFYQSWLTEDDPDGEYWAARGHRARVGEITAPTLLFGGWQDLVLPAMLDDYAALRAAGRSPALTIGPWVHVDFAQAGLAITEALSWFGAHTTGDTSGLRENPVRVMVQGSEQWKEFPQWPPPGVVATTWNLTSHGGLAADQPGDSTADRFRYDPADPTPDVGGPLLDPHTAGRKDQAARETRADVLVYSSRPLAEPLEVIGPVSARIRLRTSGDHADVFVRLCDVDAHGRSVNVCDGIQRLAPEAFPADDDGVRDVTVTLWPTAYRFDAGHRLRLQISGGSFPRFARNTGTGDPLATGNRLVPVDFEILHTSGITLPVLPPLEKP